MEGLSATLAHKGRIKSQADKSALRQLISIHTGALFFHTAIGRADHQSRMFCRLIHVFGRIEVRKGILIFIDGSAIHMIAAEERISAVFLRRLVCPEHK